MEKISVVVPCYNEEKSIPLFLEEFNKSTKELSKKVDFEIIFVNDGSKDNTLQIIKELNKSHISASTIQRMKELLSLKDDSIYYSDYLGEILEDNSSIKTLIKKI